MPRSTLLPPPDYTFSWLQAWPCQHASNCFNHRDHSHRQMYFVGEDTRKSWVILAQRFSWIFSQDVDQGYYPKAQLWQESPIPRWLIAMTVVRTHRCPDGYWQSSSSPDWVGASASLGWDSKYHRPGSLRYRHSFLPQFWRLGSQDWGTDIASIWWEHSSWFADGHLLSVSSRGRGRISSPVSLHKDTSSSLDSTLMSSLPAKSPISKRYGELGVQHRNTTGHSVHGSATV